MERDRGFFLSPQGAIWSRIAGISGLGPVEHLTAAQIMFLAFATAEQTRILAGGGTVDRDTQGDGDMQNGISTQEYLRGRKALRKGGEAYNQIIEAREKQKPFREALENKMKKIVAEQARYR